MLAHRSSPRRPPLSAPRGQLRAAYRLSAGLSPAKVARAEAVAEREIEALLAQPDFQELVEAVREIQDLPEEERLRQLEQMAWCVLELALADSDWRAAAFIADQMRRGCNPARIAGQRRDQGPGPRRRPAGTGSRARGPAEPRPPRPYDAVGAAMRRSAAAMRAAIAAEAVVHASLPEPESAEPARHRQRRCPCPPRPRRPDALTPRLRVGTGNARPPPKPTRAVSLARLGARPVDRDLAARCARY